MPTPTSGFVYITGIGVVGYPGGVATLYDGCDYNDGDVIIRKGVVTAFDPATLGVSDHDDLGNLGWTAGGHTGTASRFAWFGSTGAAEYVSVGTGLSVSANVLSCTVTAGTFDHAALTSNLLWTSSGHTGNANHVPYFSGTGAASTSNNLTFDGGELYAGAASFGVVELPAETANTAVYLDASKTLRSAVTTLSELNHLSGATSNIQAQINGLLAGTYSAGSGITLTGNVFSISAGAITNAMLAGSIAASKFVGTDIATVGTITVGIWHASVITEAYGGTGQSSYTLGDVLYASATNTLSKLAGQTTTYRKYLRQTGTGSASAAPAWDVPKTSDLCGALRVSGRLTLETGVPFSTSNQTAKTTVYYTPYNGNSVPIYDSTLTDFVNRAFAEISVSVPSTLFRGFDLYAYWTGSAVALETANWDQTTATINAFNAGTQTFTTSAAHGLSVGDRVGIAGITGTCGTDSTYGVNGRVWTVATAPTTTTFTLDGSNLGSLAYTSGGTVYRIPNTRTTALATTNGIYTKSGDSSRTYLGSGMTTGTSGQTEMSFTGEAKLLLWNQYNQMLTFADVYEGSAHSYTTGAWRFWNAKPGNRVQFFTGQALTVEAILGGDCWGGAGYVAYAIDGVSGATPTLRNGNAQIVSASTTKKIPVGVGCHLLASVQYGSVGFNVSFSDLYAAMLM